MNRFGEKSQNELVGVHSDLIIVVTHSLIICGEEHGIDFVVFDGIRTRKEQKKLVSSGVSWTMNSMHRVQKDTGYGHAVDLVPWISGKLRFDAIDTLTKMVKVTKMVAKHHRIPIISGALKRYGGDWTRRNDMYHFELDRRYYL